MAAVLRGYEDSSCLPWGDPGVTWGSRECCHPLVGTDCCGLDIGHEKEENQNFYTENSEDCLNREASRIQRPLIGEVALQD